MGKISLKNVTKAFGEAMVIPSLDLEIEDGEFVVFVGPSGCGKSTLLRLIAGLEDVTSGVIEIDGRDATEVPPAKRGLAMVFQSYALYPHMSVRKNIAFPLKMAKMDAAEQMGPDFAGKILHASIRLNGGYLMLSDEFPGMEGAGDDSTGGTKNPLALGGSPVTLHLEVEDTRTLWERAVAAGASVIMPLANQFWEASYGKLRDPFGHVWSIGGPKMPE